MVQSPTPFGLGRNDCLTSRGSQLPRALPFIFSLCCPLNDRSRPAHNFFKIGRLFFLFLFSCPSLALFRLLVLLLLLMSGGVHPNPGPIFTCSVCAGDVTWRGRSVQCCICSKWVHLKCSQFSLSKFRALGSSHSWSCPPCRNTVTPFSDSSDMYTSTVQSGPPLLMLHSPPTMCPNLLFPICPFCVFSLCPLTTVPYSWLFFYASSLLSPLDSLRVLQWYAGGLRVRSTKLLRFLLFHPVDIVCVQGSNLGSSSSIRIPGFSTLRSDRAHSRSGNLFPDATHASGGVVTFVGQGLSFSELSASSLSSLDLCSDRVGVSISLNNSSSLSFLGVYGPYSLLPDKWQNRLLFSSILPSPRNLFILGDFNCHHPLWDSRGTSDPRWEEEFDWVISSDLFPLSDPDTPTLLHRSSGSRSSPDISFANSSLAFSCLLEVLQNLGSDHLPILLSVPPCPVYRPNKPPLPSIFRKLVGMAFLSTLTLTVLLQRNTHLFLFPLQMRLSFSLWF